MLFLNGTKAIKTTALRFNQRAGQKFYKARGMGRCGNEGGALHDLPDWSYTNGTPGPISHGAEHKQLTRKYFVERVVRLAVEADQDASKLVNFEPSVRAHRQRDVSFYFDLLEKGYTLKGVKDQVKVLKESGKIPM
ncbi:predicted protein [Naegleria gruberi]|uniref:Large ribosomal subunit protein mL52 n=1 Tax=Naegleria gruberi TaxID=5762 RepID=D2VZA9_NAEGR|nr:uncharacterized protein NAEGRDRAFT_81805 [Naegleria gruberi]EFC37814.1 predicted protein [Naegleria gruberi]|eukprot:XP_002670558.1 predicted protein [Naegleria gruberi strain NEG-M]